MESPGPMTRALAQPHIVQMICNQLPKESLADAACVNHQFYIFASEAKWYQGRLWALTQRVQISRRQVYASKIRSLETDPSLMRKYGRTFRKLQFGGVKNLTLENYEPWSRLREEDESDHQILHPYLPAQLKELRLHRGRATDVILRTFQHRCHNLRVLHLSELWVDFEYDALVALMAANPLLEDLHVEPGGSITIGATISEAFAKQCARQPKLRLLTMPPHTMMTAETIESIEAKITKPFACLERIAARVASSAVPLLAKWSKNLEKLHLVIQDEHIPFLEPISKMKNLKSIRVYFSPKVVFSVAEFMLLRSLPELEEFVLCSGITLDNPMAQLPLNTDQFAEWIAFFPKLREFVMEMRTVDTDCADLALHALARTCRLIERLGWPWGVDLSALQFEVPAAPPLFPELLEFNVNFTKTSNELNKFPL